MSNRRNAFLIAGGLAGALGIYQLMKKPAPPKSKAVLVLGSGRSGTSVLARALNFMGVDLGEEMLGAKPNNPKGHFENKKLLDIQHRMEKNFPYRPSPAGYEKSGVVKPFKTEFKDYINDTFNNTPVWGYKDPRTNDFIKLWQNMLRELHVEPHFVIIVRNPLDVVSSFQRAWNREETWALRQWQLRTILSLKDTYGSKRVVISYEELFGNTLECLRKISDTLDLPFPKDEDKLQRKLDDFIERDLQTSDSNIKLDSFIKDPDVTQDIKDLYLLALEASHSPNYLKTPEFNQRVEKLYKDYLKQYGKLVRRPPKNQQSNT